GGVAFRYHFPDPQEGYLRIVKEYSRFNFMEGSFWGHPYDSITPWSPAYETYYQGPVAIGTTAPAGKNGWAFPILLETRGAWILVSEAGLDGTYGASHLEPDCTGGEYAIRFAEPGEAVGYYENTAYSTLPWSTPWRFMAIGPSLDAIVENNMTTHLAAPSRIPDPTWIQPGRATWSWWSDSRSPQNFDRLVPFINFAANMGWEYSLVDAGWNHMKGGDIEALAKMAEQKGIGLLLWYNSGGKHNTVTGEPRDRMDTRKARRAEFEKISALGIRGIKVDFFQSDKQEIIQQYLEILEDAADFHLVVNFHGCTLPRGWQRTWPNLLTMEAVRGGESYKFDGQFPEKAPAHLAIVPFTRNAVGPMDYTPGGFSDQNHPHLTTYGFELALPVIFESGIMHYTDTPEKTASLPSRVVSLLKEIPVTWDETRFISGYPGKEVVIARRKGDRWYLAGMNGEPVTKTLTLDLTGTGSEPAQIQLFMDGDSPDTLVEASMKVTGGKFTVQLLPYGGFAGFWD
ncbi:MAG: glycoside hydrolase family 97 catalytic domain-containing protein, partial [Bacteroidales bacterium]